MLNPTTHTATNTVTKAVSMIEGTIEKFPRITRVVIRNNHIGQIKCVFDGSFDSDSANQFLDGANECAREIDFIEFSDEIKKIESHLKKELGDAWTFGFWVNKNDKTKERLGALFHIINRLY